MALLRKSLNPLVFWEPSAGIGSQSMTMVLHQKITLCPLWKNWLSFKLSMYIGLFGFPKFINHAFPTKNATAMKRKGKRFRWRGEIWLRFALWNKATNVQATTFLRFSSWLSILTPYFHALSKNRLYSSNHSIWLHELEVHLAVEKVNSFLTTLTVLCVTNSFPNFLAGIKMHYCFIY